MEEDNIELTLFYSEEKRYVKANLDSFDLLHADNGDTDHILFQEPPPPNDTFYKVCAKGIKRLKDQIVITLPRRGSVQPILSRCIYFMSYVV